MSAAWTLVHCTSVQVDELDVPSANADYFFWVAYDEDGRAQRVSGVFGLEGSKIVFGGDPLFRLEDGERGAAAIAFTREALREMHGGFLEARAAEITVAVAAPPDETIAEDARAIAAVPSAAQLIGAGDKTALESNLTLTFPIDPEWCKSDRGTRLEAFGATGQLLPPEVRLPDEGDGGPIDQLRTLIFAEKIDADRVLVASERLLYVVRRGAPFEEPAFRVTDMILYAVALAPKTADGAIPIYGAGMKNDRPAIAEFALDPGGAIRFVETTTASAREGRLLDILIDGEGNLIAAGDNNFFMVRRAGEAAIVNAPPAGSKPIDIYRKVIATGDPEHPHLVTETDGLLYYGDAISGDWSLFERNDRFDNRRFYGLAASPDGREHWAAGPKGSVFARTRDNIWEPLLLQVPPRFGPCTTIAADGTRVFNNTIRAVALDDEAGYLAFGDCNAMLRVRRSDRCVSVLSAEDEPITRADLDWMALDRQGGELIVGGSNALLYSYPSP